MVINDVLDSNLRSSRINNPKMQAWFKRLKLPNELRLGQESSILAYLRHTYVFILSMFDVRCPTGHFVSLVSLGHFFGVSF